MIVVSCPNCLSKFKVQPSTREGPNFIKCAACAHVFIVTADMMQQAGRNVDEKTAEFLPELSFLDAAPGADDGGPFTAIGTAPGAESAEDGKRKGRQAVIVVAARDEVLALSRFQTTFGRRNADVTLDDPDVSRQHAVIERYDEKFLIKDLESTNGTYLNGQRITIDFLEDGDVIRMGKTVMRFQVR